MQYDDYRYAHSLETMRYRSKDTDVLLNRVLVYGGLVAVAAAAYFLVVAYFGLKLHRGNDLTLSLLVALALAIVFQPLRNWLQRRVNHMMYGERDDPYSVVTRLGRRLEASLEPETVLPAIVASVIDGLGVSYAAIALRRGEAEVVAASAGSPTLDPLRLPLVYRQQTVGELIVGKRSGNAFTRSDRRLLDDVARQAGVAAYGVGLTADLQRSREALVTAREEERRRLRRDLHDGLGPSLASLMLKVGGARRLLSPDSPADAVLADVRQDMSAMIADVRRLVYDLRPPALDDLGLVAAIRNQAAQYDQQLDISVEAPEKLDSLPAAVEVAAYRICQEAMTNAVRHAQARRCLIRLTLDNGLQIEVEDDGKGLAADHKPGIGLSSMRERAAELGGICRLGPSGLGGTRLLARLPVTE
ncbi:MAG: histidine kinase [Chloroflexota bacterium]